MWIIKLLGFIWPFIKEMVLGDKTVAEAVATNKIKTLLISIGILSLLLNLLLVQRLVVLGKNHIENLKHQADTKKIAPVVKIENDPPKRIDDPPTLMPEKNLKQNKNKHKMPLKQPGEYAAAELTKLQHTEELYNNKH